MNGDFSAAKVHIFFEITKKEPYFFVKSIKSRTFAPDFAENPQLLTPKVGLL